MFGFGKKKDKNIPVELKDLNKKSLETHIELQEKVKEYLLEGETVIVDGRLEFKSYFATEKRIIIIQAMNKKLKGIQVDSIYYNNIASVKYSEGIIKKLNYDLITIDLKGTIQKCMIQLPSVVTKEMYRIINEYIAVNA
ncbi:PH domain-containing protein [Romboutsia sp. 1001713B170131_170501_G6]|uniref:PH domain-containing protein n=1 Tax=Romboutsia sp. 1001713B170131_170501_G6 TaxID=2787108 RepID=UPI0018A8868A|nr:PH domain-containing protein [Romboutsia sp. 1001713B170131_170501_G6]